MEVGGIARVVALLEEVVRIRKSILPESDSSRIISQYLLAQALMEVGDNARAVELLEEVVRIEALMLPESDSSRHAKFIPKILGQD
jgi:hypothetical protein